MSKLQRGSLKTAQRVAVKVGTRVVTRQDGGVALGRLGRLTEQILALKTEGREVVLVTSGAIGLGAERLGFTRRPTSVFDRQACAAAGQGALMALYASLFSHAGMTTGQVLLTEDDFADRRRHVNLSGTLQRLLSLGAVPIINQNDSVSADELILSGNIFGDNDRLAALVAAGLGCDALVLLTDVDGVLTAPPGDQGAERVSVFDDDAVRIGGLSEGGRGGMGAKISAAQVAVQAGVSVVIANGFTDGALLAALSGADVGTFFPASSSMNRRRQWLAFAAAPEGVIDVNAGARDAMVHRNASLLPPGIVGVTGDFDAGDVVSVVCDGQAIARGVSVLSADAIRSYTPGEGKSRAVIHRDHVVILVGEAP